MKINGILALAVGLIVTSPCRADLILDSVNATLNPVSGTYSPSEIGWNYTPAKAFTLTGIETKFSSTDGRTVTLEIYSKHPELGGTLLRSADFTPQGGSWSGGFFAPLALTAGNEYFIGFRGVDGLGANVTSNGSATVWDPFRYSFDNDGSYFLSQSGGTTGKPILQFYGTPEPSSLALLAGTGVAFLLIFRHRRRANQPSNPEPETLPPDS